MTFLLPLSLIFLFKPVVANLIWATARLDFKIFFLPHLRVLHGTPFFITNLNGIIYAETKLSLWIHPCPTNQSNLFSLNKFQSFYSSSIMIDCQKKCLLKGAYVGKIIQSALSIIFKSKSNVYSFLILMSCSIQRFNILLLICQSVHEMRHEKL